MDAAFDYIKEHGIEKESDYKYRAHVSYEFQGRRLRVWMVGLDNRNGHLNIFVLFSIKKAEYSLAKPTGIYAQVIIERH